MMLAAMLRIQAVELAGFQQTRIARVPEREQSKKLIGSIKEIYVKPRGLARGRNLPIRSN
jgi:hypothetical protein